MNTNREEWKTNRNRTVTVLPAILILAACLAGGSFAETTHQVVLENGREIEALIIPSSDCALLMVSGDEFVDVPIGSIRSIDGEDRLSPALFAGAPLLRNETFEELLPNGDLLLHSSFLKRNSGSDVIRSIDWGIAPHEEKLLDDWHVFDDLGNDLPLQIEERGGKKRVHVDFVKPILPGDTVRYTSRIRFVDHLHKSDGTFTYRHVGDFPEDRLVTRMIRLPAGANVGHISPEPVHQLEIDGTTVIVWRRYYKKGEQFPFEVSYKL